MNKFRSVIIGVSIVVPIAAALVGIKLMQFSAMDTAASGQLMLPEPVNAAEVREITWQPQVYAVGSVMSVQGTEVSAEVEGVVRDILFDAGSVVQKGDVLVQLDDEIEKTQLRVATAAAELARSSFKRAKDLIDKRNISQADYDAASISLRQAEAQVDNIHALIGKKTVRAPFAGTLGIRRISVGQFLSKGSSIVSLQSLDSVYVDFSVPQQQLSQLSRGLKVMVSSDAYPKQPFEGIISAIDPDIDLATRNFRVQAALANPDGRLRPGMYVEVTLVLARTENVLAIPETAVLHAPFGDSVFVIEEGKDPGADGKKPLILRQQFVRLGARQGDFVVVTKGVTAGERIATTGTFKLRPGMSVVIDNNLAPDFKLAPTPDNN